MKQLFALQQLRSPLKEGSHIKPRSNKMRKTITSSLTLTSLVDAFTIIVIYLVVCSGPGEQLDIKDGISLPTAMVSSELDSSPVVTYKNNTFFIEDQAVADGQLKERLQMLVEKAKGVFKGKDASIIVQADENVGFDKLQPLMVASSYAGIRHVKFAVLQKD